MQIRQAGRLVTLIALFAVQAILLEISDSSAGIDSVWVAPALPTAGFLSGLWHGFTALTAFVISLFNPSVGIYALHNDQAPYNLGYLLGIGVAFWLFLSVIFTRRPIDHWATQLSDWRSRRGQS